MVISNRRFPVRAVAVLSLGLVVVGSALALATWGETPAKPEQALPRADGERQPAVAGDGGDPVSSPAAIGPGTEIVYRIRYLRSGTEREERTRAEPAINGLSREALAQVYPDWQIVSFGPDRVELVLEIDGVSPEMAGKYFIGLVGERVAVFYGDPAPNAPVKEMTEVTVDELQPADIQRLRAGIPVQDESHIDQVLEGILDD